MLEAVNVRIYSAVSHSWDRTEYQIRNQSERPTRFSISWVFEKGKRITKQTKHTL